MYLIGLGLGDEKDITVKGAEAISVCSKVFLEAYTSVLGVDPAKLVRTSVPIIICRAPSTHASPASAHAQEATYGKKILIADRGLVESSAEEDILQPALSENVALLVVGDALWWVS